MNLDFSVDPVFSWYVVLLAVSGVAMVVLGAIGAGLSGGWRVVNVLAGIGFAAYAFYLAFLFEGGEYRMFFQAFILPVLLIVNFVRSLANRNQAPAAPQAPAPFQPFEPAQPQQQAPVPPQAPAPAAQPAAQVDGPTQV